MKMSLSALRFVVDSNIRGFMIAAARNTSRQVLNGATLDTFVDNSTGTVASSLAAVPTQTTKAVLSGTNLASRSGFNAAIVTVNNAMAVVRDALLRNGYTPLSLTPALTGGDGTVTTQGTVPAVTKTVTGVDGSGGDAMLRSDMNAAITRARNNLATLIRAENILAVAIGISTLKNDTLGSADKNLALSANVTAGTAVSAGSVSVSDLASKAAADAALTALANDIATVWDKIRNTLFNKAATLSIREPIILTR